MVPAIFLFVLSGLSPSLFSPIQRGDQEFASRNYALALEFYDSALTTSSDSAEALWRLARLYVCIADVSSKGEQLDLYRQAESYAERCIVSDSTKSEGHTWRAAALGNLAVFEGSKAKVRLCAIIRQELDRAIELNPRDDIAYSILGTFYRNLGNVSWIERRLANLFLGELPEGGYAESERALKQAIALAPQVIRHHFELGVLYQEMDRDRDAVEEFKRVLLLPLLLESDAGRQLSAVRLVKELGGR
jgi:tetratricopeptide (TPR) repeat protein